MILLRNSCNYLSLAAVICLNAILTVAAVPEIKLVNVVFRHGDRTPEKIYEMYPNDPYLNYSFYPTGFGQLTLNGKKREYNLGKNLRDRYDNYLGEMYVPKQVVARSSDYDRTKASLQLVLAGLFPPTRIQQWNTRLNWQPIPTSYTSRVDDNLFLSDECPEYIKEYNRVLASPEVQEQWSQFDEMKQNLTKLTGKKLEEPLDLYLLYMTFIAEDFLGLPLPDWVYDYYPRGSLFDAIVTWYDISNKNNQLRKYFAGPLIRAITDNMIAKQNGVSPAKIYLYSGHESNIAALLHALQVYEPHVPEYSSAVIMELQQIDSNYYVKLLYYTGIPPKFNKLTIPGCKLLCPFDEFLDLTANLIPTYEELTCNKRKTLNYINVQYPDAVKELIYNFKKSVKSKNNNQL